MIYQCGAMLAEESDFVSDFLYAFSAELYEEFYMIVFTEFCRMEFCFWD